MDLLFQEGTGMLRDLIATNRGNQILHVNNNLHKLFHKFFFQLFRNKSS